MRKQKGFTLLELLLYVAILSLLIGAIVSLYILLMTVRAKNRVQSEVQEQGQHIVYEINRAIKNASNVTVPVITASGAVLTMTMQDAAISPTSFTLASGKINMQEATGAVVALNNNLVTASSLTFQNVSRAGTYGSVYYSFILTGVNGTGRSEFTYTNTFYGGASLRQ